MTSAPDLEVFSATLFCQQGSPAANSPFASSSRASCSRDLDCSLSSPNIALCGLKADMLVPPIRAFLRRIAFRRKRHLTTANSIFYTSRQEELRLEVKTRNTLSARGTLTCWNRSEALSLIHGLSLGLVSSHSVPTPLRTDNVLLCHLSETRFET